MSFDVRQKTYNPWSDSVANRTTPNNTAMSYQTVANLGVNFFRGGGGDFLSLTPRGSSHGTNTSEHSYITAKL